MRMPAAYGRSTLVRTGVHPYFHPMGMGLMSAIHRTAWRAAAVMALFLAILAMEMVSAPTSANGEPSVSFRKVSWHATYSHLPYKAWYTSRIGEEVSRAHTQGVQFNIYVSDLPRGEQLSFDIVMRGTATLGEDYSIHHSDIGPNRCLTPESTTCTWTVNGRSGNIQNSISFFLHDDDADEANFEYLTIWVENVVGGRIQGDRKYHLQIQDDDDPHGEIAFRTPMYYFSRTSIPHVRDNIYKVQESDSRAATAGIHVLFCVNGTSAGTVTFALELSGVASVNVDYRLHAGDIGPDEFPTVDSDRARYTLATEAGSNTCGNVTIIIRNDTVDEKVLEDITLRIVDVIGATIENHDRQIIQIEDDDSDTGSTFHTLPGSTLPTTLSEELFDREKGTGRHSFDPSKELLIGARNLPRRGVTSLEIRFAGTAQYGVDYLVIADRADDVPRGMVIRNATRSNPVVVWSIWKESQRERRLWLRLKVLNDRIEEDTESIIVYLDPGNLFFDGVRGIKRLDLRIFDNDRPAPAAEADVTISRAPESMTENLNSWELQSPSNFHSSRRVTLAVPRHSVILKLSFTVEGTATRCNDYIVSDNLFSGDGGGSGQCNSEAITAVFLVVPRATSFDFELKAVDDVFYEPVDETIVINLGENEDGDAQTRTITLASNDPLPSLAITSSSVVEGNTGDTAALMYVVSLSAESEGTVTVEYEISDDSTADATGDERDFSHFVGSPLSFSAGETRKTIEIAVNGDNLAEADETVIVRLSSPVNSQLAGGAAAIDGIGMIENDDSLVLSISGTSTSEANAGSTTNMVFSVTLSNRTPADTTVDILLSEGTATAGDDFLAASGMLTFAPGDNLVKTFEVPVLGDDLVELHETLTATLSNPQCDGCPNSVTVTLMSGMDSATGTILDNESIQISISNPVVDEGDSGDSPMLVFEVTLDQIRDQSVQVSYSVSSSGSAVSGTDFEAITEGTLIFDQAQAEMRHSIVISVRGDELYEDDESVVIELTNPTGDAVLAGSAHSATGTGTITNDDDEPILSISSPELDEGDAGDSTVLRYVVRKEGATELPVTVNYAIADSSTATATGDGMDFTHDVNAPISFTAADTTAMIEVTIVGDNLAEHDETVVVILSSPDNASFANQAAAASGTGTIRDDDELPLLSFGTLPTVVEGNPGEMTMLRFEVIKDRATALPVTVAYEISGTATSSGDDADFTHADSSLTVSTDQDSVFIDVAVHGDDLAEVDETVTITLSNPINARFLNDAAIVEGTGTIAADDFLHVSLESEDVLEGADEDRTTLTFTASLAARSSQPVSVDYQVITTGSESGTANHGVGSASTDYTAATPTGRLTFAANSPAPQIQTFEVTVHGDSDRELNETVVARLQGLSAGAEFEGGASVSEILVTGTILNDDDPTFTVSPARVDEGGAGETTVLMFEVSMLLEWHEVVTVDYHVTSSSGDGEASAIDDFVETSGTLTFNPGTGDSSGETTKSLSVEVLGDEFDEVDEETVTLVLSNASPNARIQTAEWTGVIVDDDASPVFSIDSPGVDEGDSGMASLVYTVSRFGDTRLDTSVSFTVTDGTATGGEGSADDYTPLASGQLEFAPLETTRQITVLVRGDGLAETDETVTVTLSSPVMATLAPDGTAGTGTIFNDDDLSLSIGSASTTEKDDNETSSLTFTVMLEAETPADLTVNYDAIGRSAAGEATTGLDFIATSGMLTFASGGGLTQEIDVLVTGDLLAEGQETLTIMLSNPVCALCPQGVEPRIATGTGTGTIFDNDAPLLSISAPRQFEGTAGDSASLDFEVTLDTVWYHDVTVRFSATVDGTASSGVDFEELASGILIFDSSQSEVSKTIQVNVIGDSLVEDDETVGIMLSDATGGAVFVGNATAITSTGIIVNDDFSYVVEASPPTLTEPDTGVEELNFIVTLTPAATAEFPVRYAFSGTGTEGFDFTDATQNTAPGVLTYDDGVSSRAIRTLVHSDFIAEGPETVIVTLVDENGVSFPSATVSATILPAANNFDFITLEVASPAVEEGEEEDPPVVEFSLRLSERQSSEVTVSWVLSEAMFEEVDTEQDSPLSRSADRRNVITSELASGTATLPAGVSEMTARASFSDGTAIEGIEGQLVIEMEQPTGVDGIEIQQAAGISGPLQAAVDAKGRVAAAIFDAPDTGPIPQDDRFVLSIEGPDEPVTEPDMGVANLDFTVTLTPPAAGMVTVLYSFSGTAVENADFTDGTTTADVGRVSFEQGVSSKTVRALVNSDFVADGIETVTVTLSGAEGAVIEPGEETASGTILPAVLATVVLSVSSPRVARGEDDGPPVVEFNLHLSDRPSNPVPVSWILSEARDSATIRELARDSLTMLADNTVPVSIPMVANTTLHSIRGQLVLEIEKPSVTGIEIEQAPNIDGKLQAEANSNNRVVVVVFSTGVSERDWATTSALSAFGRSIAVSLVNTIWNRIEAHRHGGADSHVNLGGRYVDVSAFSSSSDARRATRETARVLGLEAVAASSSSSDWADDKPQFSGDLDDFRRWASLPDNDRIAKGPRFALALGRGSAGGSSVVYWGAGSSSSFRSKLEHEDERYSKLKSDGSATAISLGFDYRMSESMLMGLAVSSVSGSVEYSFADSDEKGELSPSLTGFTPWLRWQSSTGLEVWGAVSIGSGSAESKHSGDSLEMDLSTQTIAVGIWNQVASIGGVGVAAKADVVMASLSTDGAGDSVDAAGADSQRIRVAAEMTPGDSNSASRTASYSFEVGARQDGGEAESGVGVDAAGNFSYTSPDGGLRILGRGSLVVFHGQEDFSETGFGLGFSYDPGGDARGLQLSLEPTWNAPHTNAAGTMWNADSSDSLSRSSAEGVVMRTRLSYGVDFAREQALATLYGESEAEALDRRLRFGAEMHGEDGPLERFRFDLYGERRENAPASDHALMLEARIEL